jgi:hypothetical protein
MGQGSSVVKHQKVKLDKALDEPERAINIRELRQHPRLREMHRVIGGRRGPEPARAASRAPQWQSKRTETEFKQW